MSDDGLERRVSSTDNAQSDKRRAGTTAAKLRTESERSRTLTTRSRTVLALLATVATLPTAVAQSCIPLADSTECRAFNSASISTDSTLTGLFPFLSSVTDTASFDTQLQKHISNTFIQQKFQALIGCSAFDSSNSSAYYARYTTSVLCNAIVQNSITPCGLTGEASRPLCANTCSDYAESEQSISASNLCGQTNSNALSQIRADFTNCALPADSLTGTCIDGVTNEPNECGYASNLAGLCSYCATSSPNATDSCCVYSNTTSRCDNVILPIVATSAMQPLFTSSSSFPTSSTATRSPSSTSAPVTRKRKGLGGGQVAGIVIGSLLGAFLLIAAVIAACVLLRRRKHTSPVASVFNQPVTSRQGPAPPMAFRHDGTNRSRSTIEALPGGRVTRMTALEANAPTSSNQRFPRELGTPQRVAALAAPPKRTASLSSGSILASGNNDDSGNEHLSSPGGTSESEQLGLFKDYYSEDDIHVGDLVATLWAYQPRANDEFDLERGDMIKIFGIWDDGWATGVRVNLSAEDWKHEKKQRDSALSNGGERPAEFGPVKAFPLVCVCLPQHWRRTIEGDSTDPGTTDDRFESP